MIVPVKNTSNNPLPEYETPGSAGLDVQCTHAFAIDSGGRCLVSSGLAINHGITVLNAPGTIDSDYRGEIGVILINHGPRSVQFHAGDRIAQLLLTKVETIQWLPTNSMTGTLRGDKGFGSTGK